MEPKNTMKTFAMALAFLSVAGMAEAKVFTLTSPDGKTMVRIDADKTLSYTIQHGGTQVLAPSYISMTMTDGRVIGRNVGKAKASQKHLKETVKAQFYRQRQFTAECNQIDLSFDGKSGVVFRAYDQGISYRFYVGRNFFGKNGGVEVKSEQADFGFQPTDEAWLAYTTNDKKPFAMAFQNFYHHCALSQAEPKVAFLPATVKSGDVKLTITESELRAYPGMYLERGEGGQGLKAVFAPYPKKMDKYAWRGQSYVAEAYDYIAKVDGARQFPWRIVAISERDTELPVNNLVYALSEPSKITDTSWIKPGKVAWDWWNDWNLTGVDFEAGINTATYKYYIDFASRNHIPYVVLDEGWYDSRKADIMNPIKDIDLQGLIDYGKSRGVDIVLWAVFNVLDEHREEAMDKYAKMGVKGFKIDFLDRDDQTATEMAYRLAEAAARHHLILDYHGYYKPTGMSRTYPNILNYEGVFGMEEARWAKADTDMPLYDVTFPYIRMMAGQVDFTPGAMRNGTRKSWAAIYTQPISMGTRCHQLACYVVHDTPFTMLADSPTNYEREQECTDLITSIPDIFDRTLIPQGEMGKYIVTARERDGQWYVGGQTNWDAREITLPLDFLADGQRYEAVIFQDGINANHNAEDHKCVKQDVDKRSVLRIKMAEGGGFVAKILKK